MAEKCDEKDEVVPSEFPPEVEDIGTLKQAQAHISKAKKINDVPGAPFQVQTIESIGSDRLRISWTQPDNLPADEEFSYEVSYKEINGKKWQKYDTESTQPIATITNLKADTGYKFKVKVINEDDDGKYGPVSEEIKTVPSPALSFITNCSPLEPSSSLPLKYPLPLRKIGVQKSSLRSYVLGEERDLQMEKTILLVGATGSGKSTLVDGMVNYILGVNWEDEFRFHVVELEELESKRVKESDQTVSQTEIITCYTIHPPIGGRISYSLRIIDTPGFGDTRGIQRDRDIVDQIEDLFTGKENRIQVLDGICFLAKAPDARLTKTQQYIFEQILLLFGKDVESNICPLITFADDREPPVLVALKQYVPCHLWFGFNNSALFANNTSQNQGTVSRFFWEMGKDSYQRFFSVLNTLCPKSLNQTIDVLLTRHKLQMTISELQKEVNIGIQKVGELESEIKIFKEKEKEFMQSKIFQYTVLQTIPFKDEIKDGHATTNCDFCKMTCHFPCTEAKESSKSNCTAMDWKGNCLQCRNQCTHSIHKNDKFIYSFAQVPVVRSRADMEKKYKKAGEEMLSNGAILARMHKEVSEREGSIREKIETLTFLNGKLGEIALMPTHASLLDYIHLLIAQEERSRGSGYENRLKILRDIKEQAENEGSIAEVADNATQIFGKILNDAREQAQKTVRKLKEQKSS